MIAGFLLVLDQNNKWLLCNNGCLANVCMCLHVILLLMNKPWSNSDCLPTLFYDQGFRAVGNPKCCCFKSDIEIACLKKKSQVMTPFSWMGILSSFSAGTVSSILNGNQIPHERVQDRRQPVSSKCRGMHFWKSIHSHHVFQCRAYSVDCDTILWTRHMDTFKSI